MDKRITIITGNAGSGKTEFALQYAFNQKKFYEKINIVDLDVINVYFRSREISKSLKENSITILGSNNLTHDNSDLPNVSYAFESLLNKENKEKVIIDLAGSENGLKLLMALKNKNFEHDLWFACNIFREETDNADKIKKLIEKYEEFSGLKITGLINNSNLLEDTSLNDIIEGEKILEIVSKEKKVPIIYTMSHLNSEILNKKLNNKKILHIKEFYNSQNWLRRNLHGKR
ncbi:hypothetical protein [Fusobacterium sp. PH5-44]|uniref:hypothetical protein n=1 Tax=unclassified Fusobacterium TaxID=2648384 RepID=UPI003D1FE459